MEFGESSPGRHTGVNSDREQPTVSVIDLSKPMTVTGSPRDSNNVNSQMSVTAPLLPAPLTACLPVSTLQHTSTCSAHSSRPTLTAASLGVVRLVSVEHYTQATLSSDVCLARSVPTNGYYSWFSGAGPTLSTTATSPIPISHCATSSNNNAPSAPHKFSISYILGLPTKSQSQQTSSYCSDHGECF